MYLCPVKEHLVSFISISKPGIIFLNADKMLKIISPAFLLLLILSLGTSSCLVLHESSKYNFNDGVYSTSRFSQENKVYILHVDEDTLAVFPVKEYKDSTAIITSKRVNYTPMQRRLRDNKMVHTFYKPSWDFDIMTIPLKYRPAAHELPNQLTTNFNGALFGGYRIDAYRLKYKRTPLNTYKQNTRHVGYSAGLYTGVGSTLVNPWVIKDPSFNIEYEGVTVISGIAVNIAADKVAFGIALGFDHLLDKNAGKWIYQGKPNIGFTLGLDLY